MRRLVLIGGSAGTGKTTTARHLAETLGAGWLQLDTIWIALRAAAEHGSVARGILDIDVRIRQGGEANAGLVAAQIAAAEAVCRVLPAVFEFELDTHQVLVADGAWLLPAFVARLAIDATMVQAVYLRHTSPADVEAALATRLKGRCPQERHRRAAHAIGQYGDWLFDQALAHGLNVIETTPFATLPTRAEAALALRP